MRRTLAAVAICAASALITLGAQSQSKTTNAPDQTKPEELTVTGCLERATGQDPTGAFMLTNVLGIGSDEARTGIGQGVGKNPGMNKPAVSPETADQDPNMTHSAYRIGSVDSDVKLTDHVGHRVELSGTVSERGTAATPAASADRPASSAPSGESATLPVLSVKSLRMVSSSCR